MTKGQRIKQRREELNLKQIELAEKVHISKQTLYKYENDIVTNIPSDRLEKIAAALETTPDYLMGWTEVEIVSDDNVIFASNERIAKICKMLSKTTPELQSAVELLLESAQQHPESLEKH